MFELLMWTVLGSLYGLFIGIIPVSGPTKALIMLFSVVNHFSHIPYEFVAFSMAAVVACTIGDSFSGVYIGIPGSNSSAATMVDGFPLTKAGQSSYAISLALTTSGIQGIIWFVPFLIVLPLYEHILQYMKVPEMWVIILFSFLSVSLLSSNKPLKGILAVIIGVGLGSIGSDVTGNPRFTFGMEYYLYDGIGIAVLASGLFCIPELYTLCKFDMKSVKENSDFKQIKKGIIDAIRLWKHGFVGGLIGFFYGLLPGYGGGGSEWISYSIATKMKRVFTTPFGKGAPEGIVAPEGVNNAGKAGALIPTILIGIPGATWAMIAMGLWEYIGFPMGDLYILEDKNFINSIIIGYLVGTISVTIFGLLLAGPISKIFHINKYFFIAFVALVTWWAIISSNFYEFILEDSIFFIVFSFCGFMLKHFKISRPAVLLGFILSERLEQFSYQLIDLYSFQEIIIRPFVIIIMLLSILMVIFSKKVKVDYV